MSTPVIRFPIKLEPMPRQLLVPLVSGGADRSEMIGVIRGALALLKASTERSGAAYRKGLVLRMRSIIDRENGK